MCNKNIKYESHSILPWAKFVGQIALPRQVAMILLNIHVTHHSSEKKASIFKTFLFFTADALASINNEQRELRGPISVFAQFHRDFIYSER